MYSVGFYTETAMLFMLHTPISLALLPKFTGWFTIQQLSTEENTSAPKTLPFLDNC
jgi:hypothetical protein